MVPKQMKQPIYVYYELDNFYQNHRRYVKSRSDKQLQDPEYEDTTTTCDPEDTTGTGAPIVPCGLIAWSLFNDIYSFSRNKEDLVVNKKDISSKSDRDGLELFLGFLGSTSSQQQQDGFAALFKLAKKVMSFSVNDLLIFFIVNLILCFTYEMC